MNRHDRYLAIEAWARARYQDRHGAWIRVVGNAVAGRAGPLHMVPSRYSVIEELAAERYLGISRRWPAETLATAYRP